MNSEWPVSREPHRDQPPVNSVGIVMPVHDALKFLKLSFYSIISFTEYPYMIAIVDNMSGLKTRKFINIQAKNHNLHVLSYQEPFNYAAEVNLGINHLFKSSNIKYGLIVNSDIVVEPNWVSKMVSIFDQDDKVGIVGPRSNAGAKGQLTNKINGLTLAEYVSGFCMIFKREVWESLHGFDESYVGGSYEDRDFCYRASKMGYKTAIDNSTYIHHYWGATRRFDISSDTHLIGNRERFFKKFPELNKQKIAV